MRSTATITASALLLCALHSAPVAAQDASAAQDAGAAQDAVAEHKQEAALFPLKLGAEWTYAVTTFDDDGRVKERKTDTSRVAGVHLFGEQRWYYLSEFEYGFFARNTPQGEEEAELALDEETMLLKLEHPRLFFKYPVTKGETYKIEMPDANSRMRVAHDSADIKVPAGTFKCVVYELREEDQLRSRMCLSPGVGLVKFEIPADPTVDTAAETRELVKYKIPKD